MNKIGILTFHWANNYGAVLQAYALQKMLKELGQYADIINFIPPILDAIASPTIKPAKLGKKYKVLNLPLKETLKCIAGEIMYYIPYIVDDFRRNISFDEFRRNVLNIHSTIIRDLSELKLRCQEYSAVIVGSDVVWHPESLKYSNYAYLLPFNLNKVAKIAFSASIAASIATIPNKMVDLYKKYLRDFSFISVRESIHARWLSEILNRKVYHTLDPTLLVSKEVFEEVSRHHKFVNKNYILFYNLHEETLQFLKELEKYIEVSYVIIHKKPRIKEWIRYFDHSWTEIKSFYHLGPREFISLIKNADLIFTDGFHGLTLSLIFERPVVVTTLGPASRIRSRIEDLTKLLELNEILVRSPRDIRKALRTEIDYRDVRSRLIESRKFTLNLLKEVISSLS